jgi:HK97 family phage portal protein
MSLKSVFSLTPLAEIFRGRTLGPRDGEIALVASNGQVVQDRVISAATALNLSTAYACVKLMSETPATLPLEVHELQTNGRSAPAREHPLWAIVHDSPNEDQTAVEFWEGCYGSQLLWGCGYGEIVRGYRDKVDAVYALRPDGQMRRARTPSGLPYYEYVSPDGQRREISADNLLRMPAWMGLSPVSQARVTLNLAVEQMQAATSFYTNGMRSTGFLQYPGALSPEDRAKYQEIIDDFVGSRNAGRVMILEANTEYKALSFSPQDAALLVSRAFEVEEICRWYGVPPILVGHSADGQTMWGSGIEQVILGWLTLSLRSFLKRAETAASKRLLKPAERARGLSLSYNLDALLRADAKGRSELWSKLAQNGVMTRNEIRSKENLAPDTSPEADELTVQGNLIPISKLHTLGGTKPAVGGGEQNTPPGG